MIRYRIHRIILTFLAFGLLAAAVVAERLWV